MTRPPATRLYAALSEICTKYGFCDVLVDEQVKSINPRMQGASEITDVILRAEGIERPEYYDAATRRGIESSWATGCSIRRAGKQLPSFR